MILKVLFIILFSLLFAVLLLPLGIYWLMYKDFNLKKIIQLYKIWMDGYVK